jgi:hypothetical protein
MKGMVFKRQIEGEITHIKNAKVSTSFITSLNADKGYGTHIQFICM